MTNALFASLHGLSRRPVSLSTTPVPLRKTRARHERQLDWPHQRRASVCGSAAALRSGCVPAALSALRSTFPARRPQTEAASNDVKVCGISICPYNQTVLKLTAQDFHRRYAPTECDLRIFLRERGVEESPPSEFEQVLMRLGQRYEAKHLATFPEAIDLRSFESDKRFEQTVALVKNGCPVLYQPVLKIQTTLRRC